jgi:hypothetical protein
MPAPSLTASKLVGHWSHGIAHGYYGGSHDFSLVLLADGRGSFTHDGWWTYRFAAFRWRLDGTRLFITEQRYSDPQRFSTKRCLQIDGPLSLQFDSAQQRNRLDLPLVDEPHDFYLVNRNVIEADLHLEHLTSGDGVQA